MDPPKTDQADAKVEKRCHKPEFSSALFLKAEQSLKEVIATDETYLASIGITAQQIADRLDYLIEAAATVQSAQKLTLKPRPTKVKGWIVNSVQSSVVSDVYGTFEIHIFSYGEGQECPFCNLSCQTNILVLNCQTQQQLWFSGLHPHLISQHSFFEGPGLKYRLEPRAVVNILKLQPNINYKAAREEVLIWQLLENWSYADDINTIASTEAIHRLKDPIPGINIQFFNLGSLDLEKLKALIPLAPEGLFENRDQKLMAYLRIDAETDEELLDKHLEGQVLVCSAMLDLDDLQSGLTFLQLKKLSVLSNAILALNYRKLLTK